MLCVLSACNPPTPPGDRVPKSRPEQPRGPTCSLSTLLFSSSARLRSSSSFRRLSSSSRRLFSSCSRLRCSRSCCLLASRSLLCCCESQMVHCQQTARPQCPGRRAVRLQGDARAGLGDPTSASRLLPCCPLPTPTGILKSTGQSWVSFWYQLFLALHWTTATREWRIQHLWVSLTGLLKALKSEGKVEKWIQENRNGGGKAEKYLKEGKKEAYLRERGSDTNKIKRCHDYYSWR